MMASATESPTMTEATQGLIDARLDTIDRMLVGRVSRQDRLAIVREVEAQIHDLLAEIPAAEVDREAVIAVLGRLDPPEAYLPEEGVEVARPTPRIASPRMAEVARPSATALAAAATVKSRIGQASGILGLVAIGLIFYLVSMYVAAANSSGDLVLVILGMVLLMSAVSALVAVGFAAYAKVRGAWAITGLVTGLISGLIAFLIGFAYLTNSIG